jgi:large subunit ribosomal protein L30
MSPAAKATPGKLKVTLLRSGTNRTEPQKRTLRGLGLKRPGKSRVLNDTVPIRGMIFKVQHLVRVDRAD